jgi:hypothetical protein
LGCGPPWAKFKKNIFFRHDIGWELWENKLHNYQSIISASLLHIFKHHKFFPSKLSVSKCSIAHQTTLRAIRHMTSTSPTRAKCSSHLTLLDFFNLTIFGNLIHSTPLLFSFIFCHNIFQPSQSIYSLSLRRRNKVHNCAIRQPIAFVFSHV